MTTPGFPVEAVVEVSDTLLATARRLLQTSGMRPQDAYVEYHDGSWGAASLCGDGTRPSHGSSEFLTILRRIAPAHLREDLGTARVVWLAPGGRLWEHVDYNVAGHQPPRYHLPLWSSPRSRFVVRGVSTWLRPGYWWRISDTLIPHGVVNRAQTPRIHVMVDSTIDVHLDTSRSACALAFHEPLPELPPAELRRICDEAAELLKGGQTAAGEATVLDLFFDWDLGSVCSKSLLAAVYRRLGPSFSADARHWRARAVEQVMPRQVQRP